MQYWLVAGFLVVSACGSSDHNGQDAPSGSDGSTDSGAPTTRVTVHVTSHVGDGKDDTTASVVFMGPTGDVVHDGPTDATGNAAWDLPDGGSVTVLQAYDDTPNNRRVDLLTTFRGVKPGDALNAGTPKSRTMFYGQGVPMTAHMPMDAYSAIIYFPCGSSSSPSAPPDGLQTLMFYDSCLPATFDMLALRTTNGQRDFMWQPGVTFQAHGDVTVNDTFAPIGHYTANLTNIPANYNVNVTSLTMLGTFPLQLDAHTFDPTVTPTNASITLQYPPGAGSGTVMWERQGQGIYLRHTRVNAVPAAPDSIDWDLSELPLPDLGGSHADATDVTWGETATTGTGDERVVLWVGQWGTHIANWYIVEPPAPATSSALVPLPPAYAADDPTANGAMGIAATVWYVDYSNLAGYDGARPYGAQLVDPMQLFLDVDHHAHVTNTM
jgi:hypothetical protein